MLLPGSRIQINQKATTSRTGTELSRERSFLEKLALPAVLLPDSPSAAECRAADWPRMYLCESSTFGPILGFSILLIALLAPV